VSRLVYSFGFPEWIIAGGEILIIFFPGSFAKLRKTGKIECRCFSLPGTKSWAKVTPLD